MLDAGAIFLMLTEMDKISTKTDPPDTPNKPTQDVDELNSAESGNKSP